MTDALAIYTPPDDSRGDPFTDPGALAHALEVARVLGKADLLPKHFRDKPGDIVIAMALARQLDENPLYVMHSLSVIQGRPCWSAQFVIARANRSGRFAGPIDWREEGSGADFAVTAYAELAAPIGQRRREVSFRVPMSMAVAEGWVARNPKYKTMPELMLRYRSAVLLVRLYAPESLAGYHERDELIDSGLDERAARRSRPKAIEAEVEAVVQPATPSPSSSSSVPVSGEAPAAVAASEGDQSAEERELIEREELLAELTRLGAGLSNDRKHTLRKQHNIERLKDATLTQLRAFVASTRAAMLDEQRRVREDEALVGYDGPIGQELVDECGELLRSLTPDERTEALAEAGIPQIDGAPERRLQLLMLALLKRIPGGEEE